MKRSYTEFLQDILDAIIGLAEELHNPYLTIVYSVFSPNMCKAVRLI